MTDSKKARRCAVKRRGVERREGTDQIITTVRIVMTVWEIIWTLMRDHVIRGTGPGSLF